MPNTVALLSITPEQTQMRIKELKQLGDGWMNGLGKAPSTLALQWLSERLAKYFISSDCQPFLYPTVEGDFRLEWTLDTIEATLEIDLKTHTGSWHSLNMLTDLEETDIFQLSTDEAWVRLALLVG
jgi:hypothetical protein